MAWLALVFAWGILTAPWLFGQFTVPWDAKAHFLPQLQFLAQSLARAESPFWTPNVFSGHPQIADPQSLIFAPPFLLYALLDSSPTAYGLDATLYLLVLASGAALLTWTFDRGWHPAAGVAAAISFMFGAAMAWRIQHVGQVMSLAYLPMVLLTLDRAIERRSIGYGIAAGVLAGLLVLGRDQVALLGCYFLAAYTVSRILEGGGLTRDPQRWIKPLVPAAIAGLAVVVVPVVLTAMVAAQSNRPAIDFIGAGRGSLHPAFFATLFAPDVFGSSGWPGPYWGPPSDAWGDTGLFLAQNMGQLYFGALPLIALLVGIASGRVFRRDVLIFTTALAVTMLYALGWYTPVFRAMHAFIPGVDLFRRPADAVFLIGFLFSVLAGASFNSILRSEADAFNWRAFSIAGVIVVTVLVGLVALAYGLGQLSLALPAIAIPAALFLIAGSAIYAITSRFRVLPGIATALVALVLVADLRWSNGPGGATALPTAHYEVLDPDSKNETIALLKSLTAKSQSEARRDRVELVGFGFHWPNASLTHNLENTLGYNPLRLGSYTAATGAEDHAGLWDQRKFSALFPSYRSTLADMLGLRYIAISVPVETLDRKLAPGDLTLVGKTADGYIYENPQAMPRVSFASIADGADFDRIVTTGIWPNADWSRTVLLEGTHARSETAPGTARIVHYGNTEIVVEADSPAGGHVVLNDPWQSWWFAAVDGMEVPILKANVLFRAVAVPPGRHTIRFTFEPLKGAWRDLTK